MEKRLYTIENMRAENRISEPVVQLMAGVSIEMETYDAAIESLEGLLKRYPYNPYTYELMANAYAAKGELETSENLRAIAEAMRKEKDSRLDGFQG